MKYFTSLLLYFFTLSAMVGQPATNWECGLNGQPPAAPAFNANFSYDGFFQHDPCGTPLFLNLRFVFLTRMDGTGSFDLTDPDQVDFVNDVIDGMNNRWGNITDADDCLPNNNYPKESNIRVNVVVDHQTTTDLWDYTVRATAMGNSYNSFSFCPSRIHGAANNHPDLKQFVSSYNLLYPNSFNLFFIEDGDHIRNIEHHLANGTQPTGAFNSQFSIFGGCSRTAVDYYSTRDQYAIMANWYTNYLARSNFGTIYYGSGTSNATYVSYSRNDFSLTANHELGHSILDQVHTETCDNLMQGGLFYDPGKRHLNPTQLDNLFGTLVATNNHKFVDCSELTSTTCDLVINSNRTIDSPISVFGDLVVSSGVTLTLTSDVYLSEESTIDVEANAKLIVDGALLTNDCGPTWKGIRTIGGNADFDVRIVNSDIENVSGPAISTQPYLFGNDPNAGGVSYATVQIDNSNFTNTGRMMELVGTSAGAQLNTTYVRNSTQDGGTFGVTNYNYLTVEIDNNVFQNISEECIVGVNGSYSITGNRFFSAQNDVLLESTAAGLGSHISNNKFFGDDTGLRCVGTSMGQQEIFQNEFISNDFGIFMDGDNHYRVHENVFSSLGAGSYFLATGNAGNDVYGNNFGSDLFGMYVHKVNDDLNFFNNCFTTDHTDVVFWNGEVASVITSTNTSSRAANNCFTHQGNVASSVSDLSGTPLPFTYAEPNDAVVNCADVLFAPPAVTIQKLDPFIGACDESIIPESQVSSTSCEPERTLEACLEAKIWLEGQIVGGGNPNHGIDYELISNQRCLKRVNGILAELYLEANDVAAIVALYAGDESSDAKLRVYSAYFMTGDYDQARDVLNTFNTEEEWGSNFVYVQDIALMQREQEPEFEPTETQLNTLLQLAGEDHPYSGYAKSVYYSLTGIVLTTELQFPENFNGKVNGTGNVGSKLDAIEVYPNPFNEELRISLPVDLDIEHYSIEIYDVLSRRIADRSKTGRQVVLNASLWPEGTYFILIRDGGKVVASRKVILTK